MNFISPVRDWISRHFVSKALTVLATLLIALLVLNGYLIRENRKLGANLNASVKAQEELLEVFEGYRTGQERILSGLAELAETQNQLLQESRSLQGYIDEAATDENRTHDPFWDGLFDRMRDDAPDGEG